MNNRKQKLLCFHLILITLAILSFLIRTILVHNFNNYDFGLLKIEFIKNYGAAFSLLHTHTSFLVFVSIIILVTALVYVFKHIKEFTNSTEYNPEPLDRLFQYLHLYKEKNVWGNENEYRMIIGNSSRNPANPISQKIHLKDEGYLLDLCPNAIKSIILGYKMSPENKKRIYKIIKDTGITIYEATPDIVSQWVITIKQI